MEHPESDEETALNRFIGRATLAAFAFAATVLITAVTVLSLLTAIGYLPYSDRPGPGWHGTRLTLQGVSFYLSWASLIAFPAFFWGVLLSATVALLSFAALPRVLIRIISGLLAAYFSLILTAAGGWIIAIGAVPIYITTVIGLFFGAIALPMILGAAPKTLPPAWRWPFGVTIVAAISIFVWWVFWPGYTQELYYEVISVTPSKTPIALEIPRWQFSKFESATLGGHFRTGELHSGVSGSVSNGDHHARALIVITRPLTRGVELRQPKGTQVVYIQEPSGWRMYPADAPTLRAAFRLGPAGEAGFTLAVTAGDQPQTYAWYPPIKSAQRPGG